MTCLRMLFSVVLVVGLAMPMTASGDHAKKAQPGSILVFPEFLTGTVDNGDETVLPRSSFEISVVCPPGTPVTNVFCTDLMGNAKTVYIKFKWVCPPGVTSDPYYCADTDFILSATINGTLWINPENISNTGQPGPDPLVSKPVCPQGFLIAWVIDGPVTQRPMTFNGLLGDAILRPTDFTHVAAYNAIPIYGEGATGLIHTGTDTLRFGTDYASLELKFYGSVRFEDSNTQTLLTLLTLNIDANTNNNQDNFVSLNFYNEKEDLHSSGTDVICWKQIEVPSASDMLGLKGLVTATNTSGRSLLGLIRTVEVVPGTSSFRGYAYRVYLDEDSFTATDRFTQGAP